MDVHLCQLDIAWENREANHARVAALAEAAAPRPGSLLVLPELFATGFSMRADAVVDPPGQPSRRFLSGLAQHWKSCVVAGLAERDDSGIPRNQAVAFDPSGAQLALYQKNRPFTGGGEHEKYPAGSGAACFSWAGVRIAPAVCYDLRFPEIFRAGLRLGAEIFVVVANWPVARAAHWVTLLQARAIENQAWVIGVNRAGADPDFLYPGRSLVVDPHGVIVADAGAEEAWIQASIDPSEAARWRAEFPAVRDFLHPPPGAFAAG